MGYEKVLREVGDFGLYQKLLCGLLVVYTTFLCGTNYYTQVFIFGAPPHRCSDPVIDAYAAKFDVPWSNVLPWIPREQGYPRPDSQPARSNYIAVNQSLNCSSLDALGTNHLNSAPRNLKSFSRPARLTRSLEICQVIEKGPRLKGLKGAHPNR